MYSDQNQSDVNNRSLNYSNEKQTHEDFETKSESNFDDNSNNMHSDYEGVSQNSERLLNGYNTMKKIMFMLHDYASLTYNWVLNKINHQIENLKLNKILLI